MSKFSHISDEMWEKNETTSSSKPECGCFSKNKPILLPEFDTIRHDYEQHGDAGFWSNKP
ncbi:MAG TPA: hypothetical protein VKM55_01775 [Candidatus Lokiarchaeia archaeon]|nr:hypothetical protein [Candidatus Lokiarchaeia archaeon]